MSQENALTFIHTVQQNSGLQAKLRPLAVDDLTGLLKVAANAGFAFDAKDYLEASQTLMSTSESTLTDDDLDLIAGGGIGSATGGAAASISLHNVGLLVTSGCNPSGGGPKY